MSFMRQRAYLEHRLAQLLCDENDVLVLQQRALTMLQQRLRERTGARAGGRQEGAVVRWHTRPSPRRAGGLYLQVVMSRQVERAEPLLLARGELHTAARRSLSAPNHNPDPIERAAPRGTDAQACVCPYLDVFIHIRVCVYLHEECARRLRHSEKRSASARVLGEPAPGLGPPLPTSAPGLGPPLLTSAPGLGSP